MKNLHNPFGATVKKSLIDKNMKQADLADMIGTSPQYLCRIVAGDRSGKKYRKKIREILEIDSIT